MRREMQCGEIGTGKYLSCIPADVLPLTNTMSSFEIKTGYVSICPFFNVTCMDPLKRT